MRANHFELVTCFSRVTVPVKRVGLVATWGCLEKFSF